MAKNHPLLLLESPKANVLSFASALEQRGYQVQRVTSTRAALEAASINAPQVLVIDATLRDTNAERTCRQLHQGLPKTRILLLLAEQVTPSERSGADITLQQPFTARKVINAINQLLPAEEGKWLTTGPIKLNVTVRRLHINGRDVPLTPKQSALLELLMRHEGEVVTRRSLIREVWETDFVGDTRTLDVHISWLRGILADDPNDRSQLTRYIKTVRSQGYRLVATKRHKS